MFFDHPSPTVLLTHLSKRPSTFHSTRFQFNNATAAAFKLNGEPDTTIISIYYSIYITRQTLNNNNNIPAVMSITIIIIAIFPWRDTVVSKGDPLWWNYTPSIENRLDDGQAWDDNTPRARDDRGQRHCYDNNIYCNSDNNKTILLYSGEFKSGCRIFRFIIIFYICSFLCHSNLGSNPQWPQYLPTKTKENWLITLKFLNKLKLLINNGNVCLLHNELSNAILFALKPIILCVLFCKNFRLFHHKILSTYCTAINFINILLHIYLQHCALK